MTTDARTIGQNLAELIALDKTYDCPSIREARDYLLSISGDGWRPIDDDAKTGASVLIFGQPQSIEGVAFHKPAVFTAHWDAIDNAFCLDGGTWLGPFVEPTHWMPKPTPPAVEG